MRILHVVPSFHPSWGGTSKMVKIISKELVKKGHEVVVCTSNFGYEHNKINVQNMDGVTIRFFRNVDPYFARSLKICADLGIATFLKDEIMFFDVVHLHEFRTFQNILVYYYARKYDVPCVLQTHGSLPRIIEKKMLKQVYDVFFGYRLLRNASKVIALTRMEANQYRSMGVPKKKIKIIPNGIDLSEYSNLPSTGSFKEKFGLDKNLRMVLYLGRIHRIKGIDILVEAFASVIENLDDVMLVVVGPDDGYLGELEALIKALNIEDKVIITGPMYGEDKLEAYVDADVYVLPSRYETFPMTVLEALACGTPIILTENCGLSDLIRDNVGLVVTPDSTKLTEALLKLLLDSDEQNMFRQKGKTLINEFNISKTIAKLEKVYEEP